MDNRGLPSISGLNKKYPAPPFSRIGYWTVTHNAEWFLIVGLLLGMNLYWYLLAMAPVMGITIGISKGFKYLIRRVTWYRWYCVAHFVIGLIGGYAVYVHPDNKKDIAVAVLVILLILLFSTAGTFRRLEMEIFQE